MDPDGNVVTLKGFALSGFEIGLTMSGDLTEGKDSIAHDWDTVMYRYNLHPPHVKSELSTKLQQVTRLLNCISPLRGTAELSILHQALVIHKRLSNDFSQLFKECFSFNNFKLYFWSVHTTVC